MLLFFNFSSNPGAKMNADSCESESTLHSSADKNNSLFYRLSCADLMVESCPPDARRRLLSITTVSSEVTQSS